MIIIIIDITLVWVLLVLTVEVAQEKRTNSFTPRGSLA